jgi:hypothetical protein
MWVVKNINNKDISKCFICSQKNYAIENIITHLCHNNDEIINSNNNHNNNNRNNNNNTNYIIIDISANNSQVQPYIESRPFFFLKIIYSSSLLSILFLGFIYLYSN